MNPWQFIRNLGRSKTGKKEGPPFAHAFRDALERMKPGWELTSRGITGPGSALIRFVQSHESRSPGHVDVEFHFDEADSAAPVLLDCVSGFGATAEEMAAAAAHLWASTSGAAILELKYSRKGDFADHYRGSEPDGLKGWHSICGAILGYGRGDSGQRLQQWWIESGQVLPALSPALAGLPDETAPHGIKILLGGQDIAEVRVNGERHEAASVALGNLDWPRLEEPGFVRSYVIALHRD